MSAIARALFLTWLTAGLLPWVVLLALTVTYVLAHLSAGSARSSRSNVL
jgi:hypothetical protein